MKIKSEYIFIILLGIALIASFIGNGWQHTERRNYKEEIERSDSIIKSQDARMKILEDSVSSETNSAVEDNTKADKTKTIIIRDKDELHEKINHVNELSHSGQLDSFARYAEEYQPPR